MASATPSSHRRIGRDPAIIATASMLPAADARCGTGSPRRPGRQRRRRRTGPAPRTPAGTARSRLAPARRPTRPGAGSSASRRSRSIATPSIRCSGFFQDKQHIPASQPAQPRTVSSAERPCCSPRPSAAATTSPTIAWQPLTLPGATFGCHQRLVGRVRGHNLGQTVLPTPAGPTAVTRPCAPGARLVRHARPPRRSTT